MPAASAGPESANLMTDSGRGRRSSHALLSRPAVSNVAGIGVIPRFRGASRAVRRAEGVWNDRCPRCSDAQLAPGQRLEPISTRNRTDLDAELDRSRRGSEPISTRNSTDLDAELDRSRRRGRRPPPPSPRSVEFRVEIGRVPRRDRFTSASRSVEFRVEIGPVPRRDRFKALARGQLGIAAPRAAVIPHALSSPHRPARTAKPRNHADPRNVRDRWPAQKRMGRSPSPPGVSHQVG